jgi:uncharacterized repeat protein (TIGR01451 family)
LATEPRNILGQAWRGALLCAMGCAAAQPAVPAEQDPVTIRAVAEVATKVVVGGREVIRLAPADRLVPADQVIYTLEVHNIDATAVTAPQVTYPIPDHMLYIANSAIGPGVEVSYSLDGRTFDKPENLRVQTADGKLRPATPSDYTHIRWQFKHGLKANSTAFVRFRALVK